MTSRGTDQFSWYSTRREKYYPPSAARCLILDDQLELRCPFWAGSLSPQRHRSERLKLRLDIKKIELWKRLLNGEGRIRTDGGLAPTLVFKTRAINHSTTSPEVPYPKDRLANNTNCSHFSNTEPSGSISSAAVSIFPSSPAALRCQRSENGQIRSKGDPFSRLRNISNTVSYASQDPNIKQIQPTYYFVAA